MSTLPISPKDRIRFSPLTDQIERLKKLLSEREADLTAVQGAEKLDAEKVASAESSVEAVRKVLEQAQTEFDANPEQPVYLISPADYRSKSRWQADWMAEGAHFPVSAEFFEALRQAADEGWTAVAVDRLFEIEEVFDSHGGDRAKLAEDQEADLAQAELDARKFPAYAALIAARAFWNRIVPYHAARHFLVGIESKKVKFLRQNGIASDATINAIEAAYPGHVAAIGARAMELMSPTKEQEKN
jgi:hypothetical protein